MAKEKTAAAPGKPKPMTKNQIAAHLADKLGVTKKQAVSFVEEYANLAYEEAKKTFKDKEGKFKSVGFTLPGLGKLVLVHRKARVGRNPKDPTKTIHIPERTVVRFRVAKAAKEAIVPGGAKAAKAAPKAKKKA